MDMNWNHKSCRYVRPGAILLMVLLVFIWVAGSGILLAHAAQSPASVWRQEVVHGANLPLQTILTPEDETLLAIYVLAYDNSRDSVNTVNLTTKYTETVQSIAAATAGVEGVTAVILADLDAYGDTHILTVQNGVVTPVAGLPDASGALDPTLTEYNTADGATLGGFLIWARQGRLGVRTTLSYIGHGAPLPPASQPSIAELVTAPDGSVRSSSTIVMPFAIDANPEFTDMHDADPDFPYSTMLTPHDLALALDVSTNGGSNPYNVLDLVHCFAASIEELYEVAPYATTTVAAPNYAYFDPSMISTALSEMVELLQYDPTVPDASVAYAIQDSYIYEIPSDRHPYILVVVDNSKLSLVKSRWDALAATLLGRFAQDPEDTANKLRMAYLHAATNGGVYDTTFCGQTPEYVLGAPDALTDITSLSYALVYIFGSDVAVEANNVIQAVSQANLSVMKRSGEPWWVPDPVTWSFSTVASGISVFSPFLPMTVGGVPYHAWQSLWYTDTFTIAEGVLIGDDLVDVVNPYPYQFINRVGDGATWADVMDAYWRELSIHPRTDVATALCLPDIREEEELDVYLVVAASSDPIQAGTEVAYTITVTNKTTLTAQSAQLTNTLPVDVNFTAVSDPVACQHANGLVSCAWPELGSHETRVVVIEGLINLDKEGPMTNRAEVSIEGETRTHDNLWIEETEVTTAWTMGMLGGLDYTEAIEGEIVHYTAVIENTGVASITDAILTRNWSWRLAVAGPLVMEPNNLGVPSFVGGELLRIPYMEPGQRLTVTVPLYLVDGPAPSELAELTVNGKEINNLIVLTSSLNIANQPPTVSDDAYAVGIDRELRAAAPGVLANDIDVDADPLVAELLDGPMYGTLTLEADGSFVYTPAPGFVGIDSFRYICHDKDGDSSAGTVVIEVRHTTYLPILVSLP